MKKTLILLLAITIILLSSTACTGGPVDLVDAQSESSEESETDTYEAVETYTYEEYVAMSGKEQEQYFLQFDDVSDFFEWYNAARAEYVANQGYIEIGEDGVVDLDEILGNDGNN